jgi:diguanylate cyclase (GGDEF)-like protein
MSSGHELTSAPAGAGPGWLDWVLSNTQTGLILLDAQARAVFANKWFLSRAGLSSAQVQDQPLTHLFPVLRGSHFERALAKAMKSGFPCVLSQTLHPAPFPLYAQAAQRTEGKSLRQSIQIIPMGPSDTQRAGQRYTLVQISDVTPSVLREGLLKAQADKLNDMAFHDGLTGIGNRRAFNEDLASELRAASRSAAPMALVILDIDHFKEYNDNYGHPAGDACLIQVAEVLRTVCKRPRDRVARFGGEEMVAILPDTDAQGALLVASAILDGVRALQIPHHHNATSPVLTASAGIAVAVPDQSDNGVSLLQKADAALYAAKRGGRNHVVLYHDGLALSKAT